MNSTPSILVGTTSRVVWVRVDGKGSFLNATGLKEFARKMTDRGYREFVVDLDHCPLMDSTFMGTLTGMALRLREIGSGELRIVHLNTRNHDLLTNLGLDQLMTLDASAPPSSQQPAQQPLPADDVDKKTRAETMLEAHQDLVEANPENEAKFKDVLEYLRHDLRDDEGA
ncbi:MAG: STAS domain-containing protein [Chthoniobacteraceae bacterium]